MTRIKSKTEEKSMTIQCSHMSHGIILETPISAIIQGEQSSIKETNVDQ